MECPGWKNDRTAIQFYFRISFVHEFRPLAAQKIRQLLDQRWTPSGVQLPQHLLDAKTAAAIIRITGGNFRLLNRLLTQMERIIEINSIAELTKAVVEAARDGLFIGKSSRRPFQLTNTQLSSFQKRSCCDARKLIILETTRLFAA